jgi:hypothetical protein
MDVPSPTAAMADAFESYEDRLSEFLGAFCLIEWQKGAFFIYLLSERKKKKIRIRLVSIGFPSEGHKEYIK